MQAHPIVNDNLYEIPSCSICLNQLVQQNCSLACGHVFHMECIIQHFQYKGTCPNCQKRAQLKEIRTLVYPVVKNNNSTKYLSTLLENIDKSEGQQIHGLLTQIKILSEKSQKLSNDLQQSDKELAKKNQQHQKLKREIQSKSIQLDFLKKQNSITTQQLKKQTNERQRLQVDLIQLRQRHDALLTIKRDMEQYKILQKIAAQNNDELVRYRKQLQNKQSSPQAMAKQFYQMLQIKNLNILKMKQKQKQYAQKYKMKDDENTKLKANIQELKKQVQQAEGETYKWKTKFEKLRDKYKELVQKNKKQNNNVIGNSNQAMAHQIEQNSLSISLGLVNRISGKKQATSSEKQLTFNLVEKPKSTIQKFTFGNAALKKPVQQKKQLTLMNFMG